MAMLTPRCGSKRGDIPMAGSENDSPRFSFFLFKYVDVMKRNPAVFATLGLLYLSAVTFSLSFERQKEQKNQLASELNREKEQISLLQAQQQELLSLRSASSKNVDIFKQLSFDEGTAA